MHRLKPTLLVTTILLACAGCDDSDNPVGSTAMSTASAATPAASTTTPATSTTPPATSAPTPATSTTTPAQSTATATPAPSATSQAQPTTTSATTTRINDNDPSIIYSRGNATIQNWHEYKPSPEDFQQDEHSSNFVRSGGPITGTGLVVNFNGTGITWIGKKGPQYGIASYSIDGGTPQTVDNYSATKLNQSPIITASGLPSESHVLSISLLNKKQSASASYWQTIDGFNIEGASLSATQAITAGFNSSELKFTGTWDGGKVTDGSDLSGGHYWSKEAHASVSWTFVGSLIEVFGRPDYENGYMDVYIDANPSPVASVDAHWGSVDDDSLNSSMLFAKKLAPGQHTIKLVVAGKHDATARDNYVQVDQFVAFQ